VSHSPLESWFDHSPAQSLVHEPVLQFDDLSGRSRLGCKGPGAEAWLATGGYRVPSRPNTAAIEGGVLVARLATSEFLLESVGEEQVRVASSRRLLESAARPADVYPVARQDLVIGIHGPQTNTLLRQICSVDFAPLFEVGERDEGPIVLTSMIGVGVVAWPQRRPPEGQALERHGAGLTLWIDPSFAHYFWTTLLEVGRDLGGLILHDSSGARE